MPLLPNRTTGYNIIKAHGGEKKVETREGEGTTFTIQLCVGGITDKAD